MEELLHMNYKQNTILSNKLVVGLRSAMNASGSSFKDVWAETTTNLMSS